MKHRRVIHGVAIGTVACVLANGAVPARAVTAVTTCGQTVTGPGMLVADLDCSAGPDPAIILNNGALLDLAGFTLTGTTTGVRCEVGRCKIVGPGTIRRSAPSSDLNVIGVLGLRRARVTNVTVENWGRGVFVLGPVDVRSSTLTSNHWGVMGEQTRATDSTFIGNYYGTYASEGTQDGIHYKFWPSRIRRCTFSGNTIDVAGFKRPTVQESPCTTSDQLTIPLTPWGGGDEWGVCS